MAGASARVAAWMVNVVMREIIAGTENFPPALRGRARERVTVASGMVVANSTNPSPRPFPGRGEGQGRLLANLLYVRELCAANPKQFIRINREHRVWRAASGEDLIEFQQVNVQQDRAGICMREGWHAADGKARLFTHECGVCFGEFVTQNRCDFFLINTVGAAGDDEYRLAGAGALEDDAFRDLRDVAEEKQGCFCCGATGVFVFDDDGFAAHRNERVLHLLCR